MTEQSRDKQIIEKILDYCCEIEFTHNEYGHNYDVFLDNPTYKNATALCLLQIGELVTHLSEAFISQHNDIPWKDIRGMRNVIAHRYGHIDAETIWETSENDIQELKDYCQAVLGEMKQNIEHFGQTMI